MEIIGELVFATVLLILGLIATVSPSGVTSFYERLGVRLRFGERTTKWSIRSGGLIALLIATGVFWVLIFGR